MLIALNLLNNEEYYNWDSNLFSSSYTEKLEQFKYLQGWYYRIYDIFFKEVHQILEELHGFKEWNFPIEAYGIMEL